MPKITKARDQNGAKSNTKGCNCKRSGCLKNYCECYEAKIVCSSNCKCLGCKNFEERSDTDPKYARKTTQNCNIVKGTTSGCNGDMIPDSSACGTGSSGSETNNKYDTFKQLTHNVTNAIVQCLLAQATECEKYRLGAKDSESMILYEFQKCLDEINDVLTNQVDI